MYVGQGSRVTYKNGLNLPGKDLNIAKPETRNGHWDNLGKMAKTGLLEKMTKMAKTRLTYTHGSKWQKCSLLVKTAENDKNAAC